MSEVSKKFKVGDKVKVVSHKNTVKRFGGNSCLLAEIGTESVVNTIGDFCIGITGSMFLLDIDDVVLLDNLKLVNKEVMSEQTTTEQTHNIADVTPKTPYQEKGYTENSLFKFVGDEGQFDNGELIKLHYDDGDDCPDFKSISRDRKRYCCLSEVEYVGEEGSEDMLPDYEEATVKGIISDGGSSDYYFTKLPQHIIDSIVITGGIEIKDIARYVYDNDADAFNIIKAEKRIIEERKGKGKLGNTALYDANKIVYFANEQLKAIKHTEESHG